MLGSDMSNDGSTTTITYATTVLTQTVIHVTTLSAQAAYCEIKIYHVLGHETSRMGHLNLLHSYKQMTLIGEWLLCVPPAGAIRNT